MPLSRVSCSSSSIEEAIRSKYTYFPANKENYLTDFPIITVIIDCYYRLDLVKKSIQSVLEQSYCNVELILVDNGAEKEVSSYLNYIYSSNSNTSLIVFSENQFSWNDTQKIVSICWNSALLHCSGDFVGHLSYDDMISYDCTARMVKLFMDNDNCVTASPLPVSIKEDGSIDEKVSYRLDVNNKRPMYINGKKLALDFITGNKNNFFSAPGGVMFTKRDILVKYGGFDRASDITQIIKFAVHGDSGFDKKAKLFWRHHDDQLNKKIKQEGVISCGILTSTIRNENIIGIWDGLFSKIQVILLKEYIKKSEITSVMSSIRYALHEKNLVILLKILRGVVKKCPYTVLRISKEIFFRIINKRVA
jgi:glycosyltransferase involved in cell wall biosynthesis